MDSGCLSQVDYIILCNFSIGHACFLAEFTVTYLYLYVVRLMLLSLQHEYYASSQAGVYHAPYAELLTNSIASIIFLSGPTTSYVAAVGMEGRDSVAFLEK